VKDELDAFESAQSHRGSVRESDYRAAYRADTAATPTRGVCDDLMALAVCCWCWWWRDIGSRWRRNATTATRADKASEWVGDLLRHVALANVMVNLWTNVNLSRRWRRGKSIQPCQTQARRASGWLYKRLQQATDSTKWCWTVSQAASRWSDCWESTSIRVGRDRQSSASISPTSPALLTAVARRTPRLCCCCCHDDFSWQQAGKAKHSCPQH